MSKYEARIKKTSDNNFYTFIVRIDYDGEENVINEYKCRHFATFSAAQKSTNNYLAKLAFK